MYPKSIPKNSVVLKKVNTDVEKYIEIIGGSAWESKPSATM
jgi:hypothetical protein